MRPERTRASSEKNALARARMILKADLYWLHGYPVSSENSVVLWQPWCNPERGFPELVHVDATLVTRAQQKLAWCLRAFSKGSVAKCELPGIHPNWFEQAQRILEHLATRVQTTRVTRASLAADALAMDPSFSSTFHELMETAGTEERSFLNSVAWVDLTCPQRQIRLSFVCDNFDWLRKLVSHRSIGPWSAIQLVRMMEEDGPAAWSWLPKVLEAPECFGVPTSELTRYVESLKAWLSNRQVPLPQPPGTQLANHLLMLITRLFECRASHRRIVLELAPYFLRADAIAISSPPWQFLQDRILPLITTIQKQAQHWNQAEETTWCELAIQEQSLLDRNTIYDLPFSDVVANLITLAEYARPALIRSVRSVLQTLEDAHTVRSPSAFDPACFFLQILLLRESAMRLTIDGNSRKLCQYLQTVADHLKNNAAAPALFRMWTDHTRRMHNSQFCHWRKYMMVPADTLSVILWRPYLSLIQQASDDPAFDEDHVYLLESLLMRLPQNEDVFATFRQLKQIGDVDSYTDSAIEIAQVLQSERYSFVTLAKALSQLDKNYRGESGQVRVLQAQMEVFGWPDVLPQLLCGNELGTLKRLLSTRRRLSPELRATIQPAARPENPTVPSWTIELPEALHGPVATLAAITPNARRLVARILHAVCPLASRTEREIAALEARVGSHPQPEFLLRRLGNLRQRRNAPAVLLPAAIEKLTQKLQLCINRHVLADFHQRIQQTLISVAVLHSRLPAIGTYLSNRRYAALIEGLMILQEPFRSMGFRLLRLQWNGEHWDRIREPENQRFLSLMERRGIRTAPWLSSETLLTTQYQRQTVRIGFETDPVDILLMGHYFDTCLSPDGFNFFSAVANAVDVNKRILFARDQHNRVVGRCLLVLGDSGMIMTYHPYCHENDFPMDRHVASIASKLAADMGTVVAQHDTVSSLVAPRWYDDSARDLGQSITSKDSPLLLGLQTVTEDDVVETLQAAFGLDGLTVTSLSTVLRLPVFAERPNLVRPLIPFLRQFEKQLSSETLLRAANCAHQCGAKDFAAEMLLKYSTDFLTTDIRRCRIPNRNHFELIDALTAYDASRALRILRATRGREVRDDQEETHGGRLKALSVAHAALGRRELAKSLLQKMGTQNGA